MSGNDNQVAETPLLKRLNEQRVAAARMAREFAERAAEGSDLSGEDEKSYRKANVDIDKYGSMIQDEIKRIQEERSIEDAYNEGLRKMRGAPGSPESRGAQNRKSLGDQMREDLQASRRGESRNGGMYQAIPEHRANVAYNLSATTGNPGRGAELVPTTLVENLYQKLFDDSSVLQAGVTMLRTESGEPMKLPRLTALNNKAGLAAGNAFTSNDARIAEAANITAAEPMFDQVQLDAYKYAQFTQVSRELVEDGVLDIEALIGQVLGRNIANYVGYDLTLGTGSTQPRGVRTVVSSGTQKVASTANGGGAGGLFPTANFDSFFDVMAKLKPGYRRNAKWMINDQAVFALRKLKMNGVYAWEPNLQGAGQPDQFLGYPLLTDPNLPVPATSAGITAIFGDFSAYFVRMVRDVRIEWSMEYAWVNDLLSVKAVVRADGDAIDDAAFAGFDSVA